MTCFIVWGGYSYNLVGPFDNFQAARDYRNRHDLRVDRSRIFSTEDKHFDNPKLRSDGGSK